MSRIRRLSVATVAGIVAIAGMVAVPDAKADETYAGTCTIQLNVHRTPDQITFDTRNSGVCLVNHGDGAHFHPGSFQMAGALDRLVPGLVHNCQKSLGDGTADIELQVNIDDVWRVAMISDVDVKANAIEGAVHMALLRHTPTEHIAASLELAEFPSVTELCSSNSDDVIWFGDVSFEMSVPS